MANTKKITGKVYDWNNGLAHEQEITPQECTAFVRAWRFGGGVKRVVLDVDGLEIPMWDYDEEVIH